MTGETWPAVPLADLCDPIRGITYGIVKVGDFIPGGVPVIRGGDIRGGCIECDDSKRVTEAVSNQFARTILRGGEIVLNLISDPGHSAVVPSDLAGHNVSRDVAVIPLKVGADVRFVDFFLRSNVAIHWLTARLQGSVTQKINLGTLRELPVSLPPLPEQRAITHILGTLEDKIELNRKTNETLEGMARALFKSWFVDFDPVRAKAEGRSTGLPDEISDLFPDSFEDSELGEIPSGWCATHVGERLQTVLGGTPSRKRSEYWGGEIPWIGSGMVNEFRVTRPAEMITELGLKESATKLLPVRSTLIAITGATLGQASTNEIELCANQSVVAILPSIELGAEYIYLWTLSNIDTLVATQTGGAQQHVNKNNVNELPLLAPSDSVLAHFGAAAKPLFDKIAMNIFTSEFLRDMRDALLPKLISGELRIPDAERLLEEAGV
jgi:type I restriction enzyme S subunit